MSSSLVLALAVAVIAFAYGPTVVVADDQICPPPESIQPCRCYRDSETEKIVAYCSNFTDASDIRDIFNRNSGWKFDNLLVENCVMPFFPAEMIEEARYESLTISSTTLTTLFDRNPVSKSEISMYLNDIKVLRNFQWSDISNITFLEFGAINMNIQNFGKSFRDSVPTSMKHLWFENTQTTDVTDQAFSNLVDLELLVLKGGLLKELSRDVFPKPANFMNLDFSSQKLSSLPEDFFTEMPRLVTVFIDNNMLTTMSEKVFINTEAYYFMEDNPFNCDCKMKWITTGKIDPTQVYGTCAEPSNLKGKKLGELTGSDLSFCE